MIMRTLLLAGALMVGAQPYADSPELDRFVALAARLRADPDRLTKEVSGTFEMTYAFLHWEHLRPLSRTMADQNR